MRAQSRKVMARLSRTLIDNFASSGMAHVKITNIILGIVHSRRMKQQEKAKLYANMQDDKMKSVALMARKLRLISKVKGQMHRLAEVERAAHEQEDADCNIILKAMKRVL